MQRLRSIVPAVLLAAVFTGSLLLASGAPHVAQAAIPPTAGTSGPPVLAYYYMWFNANSWSRAKNDLPSLGGYDSTDPAVIAQHVTWARASGVNAFIASWKNTPQLDLALAGLVAECQRQGLKLVLIYEGLDVNRNPIPASTVGADLVWFENHYGSNPVFDLYGKPAVIWSGTWRFTDAQIAGVRAQVGAPDKLLLLGSEKNSVSYQPRAALFDGDAYYWSSADPLTTPGYEKRLSELSAAVHAHAGLWLAPAPAGFDGRLNGGTTSVDRRNGATLIAGWREALATQPDGIAVISWNEFTEASYVEPSVAFGSQYLQVLASLTGAAGTSLLPVPAATARATPSRATSAPPSPTSRGQAGPAYGASIGRGSPPYEGWASLAVGLLVMGILIVLGVILRTRSRYAAASENQADVDARSDA
jgi:hypothetical protein